MTAPGNKRTRVLLVQPPFVQLNAPYPAPYYLASFLGARGVSARAADHSIETFSRIFCRSGIARIFSDAREAAEARLSAPGRVDAAERAVRENLSRYLSQERMWISSVDRTVAFLRGEDREFGHLLAAANGALPAGDRTARFIESCGGSPGPDDAPRIATLMIADLADFIAVVLDPSFALVRYAESIAASVRRFADVEETLDGYVLRSFYQPLLEDEWERAEREGVPTEDAPLVLACTVPFPGCLAGALAAGRSAKARFGRRVRVVLGGGYANTELRSVRAAGLFDYIDFLSFDRGYGSLAAILDLEGAAPRRSVYKTVYRSAEGTLVGDPEASTARPAAPDGQEAEGDDFSPYAAIDREAPVRTFPDYRDADFSRYIRPVDDENPMHRLWSDGRWLKAYLAHGCYWHACAFCDVALDYIRGYVPADADALFSHLTAQAALTGVRGVHLVDEAAPPETLVRLAQLNRAAGLPLVFWGNIRFEKDFTPDVAAVLASGGLLGVSAGIEVASERGFKRVGKGLGLSEVVRSCAAFKEAGILVHAYLIFGFWDEDDGEIIDSAETVRQLFRAGLLDSAFWHKFVLTRHSRIMREQRAGRHPGLEPIVADAAAGDFADNDLRFAGEHRTDRWSAPLDALTAAWMSGEALDRPVREALPFKAPSPTVRPDLAESLLDGYARDRDEARETIPGAEDRTARTAFFLGSDPVLEGAGAPTLAWTHRLERRVLAFAEVSAAAETRRALREAADGMPSQVLVEVLREAAGEAAFPAVWRALREGGLALCAYPFQPLPAGRSR
jgi:hypothetical protein